MINDILSAFNQLGESKLHVQEIYKQVRKIREERGEAISNDVSFKAYIRYTLQTNSRGRGKNLFIMIWKGTGLWALR